MSKYIWQLKDWPKFVWDAQTVAPILSNVVFREGEFLGRLAEIGFENKTRAGLEALSVEIVNSAAIEGESLNLDDVRSSVARRMEVVISEAVQRRESHLLDARVEMMLDATHWVVWFLLMQARAIESASETLRGILDKARFWQRHAGGLFNAHQREMLNRLLDGFNGNLTSSKWAKICKVSQDTASREIAALIAQGVLRQEGAGRSTHYVVK